ncbi:hypothetical protein MTO96_022819 [Rhipicephalus appendiculatus]
MSHSCTVFPLPKVNRIDEDLIDAVTPLVKCTYEVLKDFNRPQDAVVAFAGVIYELINATNTKKKHTHRPRPRLLHRHDLRTNRADLRLTKQPKTSLSIAPPLRRNLVVLRHASRGSAEGFTGQKDWTLATDFINSVNVVKTEDIRLSHCSSGNVDVSLPSALIGQCDTDLGTSCKKSATGLATPLASFVKCLVGNALPRCS